AGRQAGRQILPRRPPGRVPRAGGRGGGLSYGEAFPESRRSPAAPRGAEGTGMARCLRGMIGKPSRQEAGCGTEYGRQSSPPSHPQCLARRVLQAVLRDNSTTQWHQRCLKDK
ncbi:hypothetical protein JRQ81_004052, partial [Phrynocephalus forsythii]